MTFPLDPYDGQLHVINDPSGTQIVYEYNKDQNTWELVPGNSDVNLDIDINVYTDSVITVPLNPFVSPVSVDTIDDIVNLQNQREINWVIAELALDVQSSQTIQDERISANELATQDLYSITDTQNTRINTNSALILDNRNDIVELEEELEALAPSLSRGEWSYNPLGVAGVGQFSMYDSLSNVTSDYNLAATIFVNPIDSNGTPHGFSDVVDGAYLEIFDSNDADFGLYNVTDIDDQTGGQSPFWIFTVDFVKSNASPSLANDKARFKFFELADAADPTTFVVNIGGDEMQGPLQVTGPRDADLTNGSKIESTIKVLNVDSGQNSSLNLKHNGNTRIYVGATQTSFIGDIKFNNGGSVIYAGNDKKAFVINNGGVFYDGDYTVDRHVATKKNVEEAIYTDPTDPDTNKYVDRAGDTMSGELEIKTPDFGEAALTLHGKRDNTTFSCATVAFKNQKDPDEAYAGYLTYRTSGSAVGWFGFSQDVDLNNHGLHSVARIRMEPNGGIGSGNNTRLTFHNASTGQDGEGLLVVPRPSNDRRGFAIRGNDASGDEVDLLYTYTNPTGTPDAANYVGKIASPKNLVNKAYVDAAAGSTVVLIGTTCNWRKGGLDDTTLERQYFGIERAGSTTSQVGYGSVLYLNKLIAIDGTLQPLKNYTPTDGSLIEVWSGNELWFKSLLDPTTYKVASRNSNEIVCDFTTYYPIVSKSGTNWSGSTYYRLILTGMKYTG